MKTIKNLKSLIIVSVLVVTVAGCSMLKDLADAVNSLSKLQFKLDNVSNFNLVGIDISKKNSIQDVNVMDVVKLTNAFATKSFPADFILNVGAFNPNNGTNGTKQTEATITSLDYRLILDEVHTINGDISAPLSIPGSNSSVNIPLRMSLDLFKFFGDRGYESLANLALAIGGATGSPARVKLDIKPTVKTSFGPITYPSRLTVVDKEWR